MKKMLRFFTACLLLLSISIKAKAQNDAPEKNSKSYGKQVSLLFGLNQPIILHGINIEANYWTERFVIDYSHGFGLEFKEDLVPKEAKQQHLQFNVTHSLGFGFGYRITRGFNIRLEPKLHIWDVYYDNTPMTKDNRITKYNTFTMGVGAYYKWQPFNRKDNLLKGITIAPSIRFWPLAASSLKGNKYTYYNAITEKTEVHKANNIGISNTPLILNISIGYTLDLSAKR